MPMVTPTLNIPQPTAPSVKASAATATPAAIAVAVPVATKAPDAPSTTVTLSPQAMSAAYAASHPSTAPSTASPAPAPAVAHDDSVYESLKNGLSTAVTDAGDAIAGGAHAVVDGVETVLSTANRIVKGTLELPFAVVAKSCDAVGSLIDEL